MSSFVHCMICYNFPSKENREFHLSSCSHMACSDCVAKGCFALKCRLCKKGNPRVLAINAQMRPDYAEMFSSMSRSLTTTLHDTQKLCDFQIQQRQMMMKNLSNQCSNFNRLYAYCQSEVERKKELKLQLSKQMEFKKKAEKYIMELRARLSGPPNEIASTSMNFTVEPGTQRIFVASTPYQQRIGNNTEISTEKTVDASLSFSAATGFPKSGDACGDLSALVKATSAVNLKTPNNQGRFSPKKRSSDEVKTEQQLSRLNKTEIARMQKSSKPSKKTRLDLVGKSQPLPGM